MGHPTGCIDFAIFFVSDGYLRVIYYPPGTGNFLLPGIPGFPLTSLADGNGSCHGLAPSYFKEITHC